MGIGMGSAQAQVDLEPFLRKDDVTDLKLSPTGEFLAATVPMEDKTALTVIRRSDNKTVGSFALGKNSHVSDFTWIGNGRLLIEVAEKFGALDKPIPTGELFAMNADGTAAELLVGFRVASKGPGTRIQPKKVEAVAAFLAGTLPDDERNVVVTVWPFNSDDPYTRAELLDVYSGRRRPLTSTPVRRASFHTDPQGVVRFALGADTDNASKLYYRGAKGGDWRLINDENLSHHVEQPLGFSADGRVAYLRVEKASGSDAVESWNAESGERKVVARDAVTDPYRIIYRNDTNIPVGIFVVGDKPRTLFFDEASPEARMYRSLEAVFPGQAVFVTSSTRDGRLALVETYSDRNPGDFYLFDAAAKKADRIFSRRAWFDPEKSATAQPISVTARDGQVLHGFLTLPAGGDRKKLATVVMPHGGPFGEFDKWTFDDGAQLLAQAGYAVLQINYRGSGNYGRAFQQAGAQQWGGTMQDDVTDATRWAIQQGIADAGRICLYGASYGAYASLMGVAKEPSLYRCAAGYVGVYDLPMMYVKGDIQTRASGEAYLHEWLGPRDALAAVSPVNLADRIKVPVFLAAGGEDERAPIAHSKKMEAALKRVGVPVETLYMPTEGHGFYTEEHQREYYTRLLAFLSRSLGGAVAKPAAAR
ncbi:alpha/beta hydrolase family protein [Xanthomonas sp. WHRI 7945]|nr:S9 family peptidase [Xanthomonas campestris pv. campestris]